MYNFDRDGLVASLASRPLSSHEGYQYILSFFLFGLFNDWFSEALKVVLGLPDSTSTRGYPGLTVLVYGVIFGFVFLIGRTILNWLYESNGGSADDQFVGNILAASWVVNLRYSLIYYPLYILSAIVISPRLDVDKKVAGLVATSMFVGAIVLGVMIILSVNKTLRSIRALKLSRRNTPV
jgi:hypothetical protein